MSRGLTDLSPPARRSSGRGFHRSSPQSSTRFPTRCSARPSGRSSPQSSTRFPSRCSALSSGRSLKTFLKPPRGGLQLCLRGEFSGRTPLRSFPQSSTRFPTRCSTRSSGRFFPSIFRPVSLTLLSSALSPVLQNNSRDGLRGGLQLDLLGRATIQFSRTEYHPIFHAVLRLVLRHGNPVHRYSSGIPACRTIQQSLSNRPLTGPRPVLATTTLPTSTSVPSRRGKAVIYHPFATATLPTDTPVASPRAEQSNKLSQTGPLNGPRPVLAKATLSTGTPVASRRAEQSDNLSQTDL